MLRAIALARAAIGAATFLTISSAFAGDLTSAEIQNELVGRQIVWWEDGGWLIGRLTLGRNGSAEISIDRPEPQADVGHWAFRDGELCTEWSRIRSGAEKCYSLRRAANGRFVTSGGNIFEIREAGV
ncbi:hypothetical protein SAZ10_33465 [Mesorhizobium sp. BAC0120]|uniref:hypothetical protein n=1 Tax=Mesorhizobium sp. BAC0120 TaxID=3090670 RepID=UPI00298C64C0|nr:hypothetical protein [Mesorhizobium sp. BAC0120]MDW6026672.1 hypothetical protein [Mesorhizobium sp. BAC0120]